MTCTSTFVRSRWLRKCVTQSVLNVRAFNQAGNVSDHEAAIVAEAHDAEVGSQRGERIVGDLRSGRRDARDECGLARVGEAHETTSATSFSRSRSCLSSPSAPGSVRRGARFVDDVKAALPRPPRPPCATRTRWPIAVRSATFARPSAVVRCTTVPTGDFERDPCRPRPCGSSLHHGHRGSARNSGWETEVDERVGCGRATRRRNRRVRHCRRSAHRGARTSLAELRQPLPPLPAVTRISTSSTNTGGSQSSPRV